MNSFETQNAIAAFHSKGFRYPFWPSLLVLMQLGLLAMFASFSVGVPVFVSVAAMLAAITLGIGFIGGHTSYFLHNGGIVQQIKPFNWMPIKLKPLERSFEWVDIKSYKMGSDLSRSMHRYNYLYISVRKMPYQLRLSDDQADKAALQQFEAAFEKALANDGIASGSFSDGSGQKTARLLRKPDFYHTRFAHIIFWFFIIVFSLAALAMITTGNIKAQYIWRFSFIIIPGLGYMAYRLYGRGRQE